MSLQPYYSDPQVTVYQGDCLHILTELDEASVDAVVTDPPYGLEFMGREWDSVFGRTSRTSPEYSTGKARIRTRVDQRTNPAEGKSTVSTPEAYVAGPPYQQWAEAWAARCLRVLKPGGHLLAFGGTRTWHRLVCALEDAGLEIRDSIAWFYGSGFPKSLNLGDGCGTGLKPAHEPIALARKPLAGTVAANVLAHGTGALNIDGCRVRRREGDRTRYGVDGDEAQTTGESGIYGRFAEVTPYVPHDAGRWPANVVLSHPPLLDDAGRLVGDACADGCAPGCPVAELDQQSGTTVSRAGNPRRAAAGGGGWRMKATGAEYADAGGASRFFPTFRYEAKADNAERPRVNGVAHPTVKPLALMRWLVRLATPARGLVLDPFAGSGTTAEACVAEGFRCLAIERDSDYLPLIRARLAKPLQGVLPFEVSP